MDEQQNTGRPLGEQSLEDRLAALLSMVRRAPHDRLVSWIEKDIPDVFRLMQELEAGAASYREALQRIAYGDGDPNSPPPIVGGWELSNRPAAGDIAKATLSGTSAGQSLLDRIKTLEEQVRRLTPSAIELRALEAGARLLEGESFDAEAELVRGYLNSVKAASPTPREEETHG